MSNKHISMLSYNEIEKMMNKTVRIKEKEETFEDLTQNQILIEFSETATIN